MALYDTPMLKRQGITPFVSNDDLAAPATPAPRSLATPPAQMTPQSSWDAVTRRVSANAAVLKRGLAAINGIGDMSPKPVSQQLGTRLARASQNAVAHGTAGQPSDLLGNSLARPNAAPATMNAAPAAPTPKPISDITTALSAVPVGRLPVAPRLRRTDGSGIDTGVTLPDGRKLPYGAMVNGVPTFSDGSGGLGAPPTTMTKADIADLGNRLDIVPAAALTRAALPFNSDDSDANIAARMRADQGGKFGVTPEMKANADLTAVINQDPRSTLGLAALNASRRASGATTTLQRKAALDDLAGLNDTVRRNAIGAVENEGANQRANIEAQSVLQRQGLANTGDLARQQLANEGDLARTELAGKYGIATVLASPKKTGEMTVRDYLTQLNKGVQGQIAEYNKNQGVTPAKDRQPLSAEMISEMRAIQAKALGLRVGTTPDGRRVVEINGQVMPL